jgi:hypothetical protein
VKNCASAHEAAFLPSTFTPFEPNDWLTSRSGPAETATAKALSQKIAVLVHCSLKFLNLITSWISQRM